MQNAIVHLGYHKTATTWLQEQVFPRATSHDFVPRKAVQDALLAPSGLHFCADNARRVLSLQGRNRPVLLSEENLSGYIHNGGLHGFLAPEMARRVKAVFPDARIVVFIRNQLDICRASYAQYVSGGGTWSARRYFETARFVRGALTRPWKAPVFEFEHFEYDRLVSHYDSLFGAERVHVYPYEWLQDRSSMLKRMEKDLGLSLDALPPEGSRANRSLGAAGLTAMRAVNLFTRQSVVNKDRIVDLPGGQVLRHGAKWLVGRVPVINRSPARLSDRLRRRIAEHYPQSNRRLMAMRDLPLDDLGYPV
ncbi:sulfotransferase family protein [Novosphingobium malaysiense]|uniref:Sulfotransferase domain-containing protein n=1 Tax=Novosphingobium malaysiense TaxID=1348853 RepID=A0A0B1ZU17_9SPHN|nr:hypothetical protein [Novosphingobium malaysiense]KHK92638.1 hypothetical protein LK12_07695 [Novosphingobium malaysiense]